MATLSFLLQKEFLQIRRNSFLPRLIVAFPIMIMCVMPWVMNMEVRGVVVDIVDRDHSVSSRQLVRRIEASHYFVFGGECSTYRAALSDIEHGRADIAVVIPPSFGSQLRQGERPNVLIAANAVNGTKGGIGSAYLAQIISTHGARTATASGMHSINLYNRHQDYKVFMIPALMAILIMLLCGFLPALNIVGEKERGTIEQINVTPVRKRDFILAKLIPYWVIAFLVMTICFLLAWAIYGITCQGSLWLVYLLAMLLAVTFSSIGLAISNYSETMQQAMLVMWFFVVILMLLSGLFTPVRSMPDWVYATTYVNPMHYFIDAIRTVFVRGGGIESIAHQVVALAVIASGTGTLAILTYRKNH